MEEPSNTILLLHPCALLRAGVRSALEPIGMHIVEATDAVHAWEIAQSLHPELALLDAAGPSSHEALYLTELLSREKCRIVVFAPYDEDLLFEYRQRGAAAYAKPTITSAELVAIIQRVAAGSAQISLPISFVRVQKVQSSPKPVDPGPLTPTELAALKQVMCGLTNKQVSLALGCCDLTVKNHLNAILRKLNAHNRTHAVMIALSRGFIALDEPPAHALVLSPEAFEARGPKRERRVAS